MPAGPIDAPTWSLFMTIAVALTLMALAGAWIFASGVALVAGMMLVAVDQRAR